ncbi:hypothetical protein HaLaN_25137, partial [Haematococcus lacustris]
AKARWIVRHTKLFDARLEGHTKITSRSMWRRSVWRTHTTSPLIPQALSLTSHCWWGCCWPCWAPRSMWSALRA